MESIYGCICFNKKKEVLLVSSRAGNKWSFPKGHANPNEKGIYCALRELKEETGFELQSRFSSCIRFRVGAYYIFQLTDEEAKQAIQIRDTNEISEARWFPLSSLPETNTNVDISMMRTLLAQVQMGKSITDYFNSEAVGKNIARQRRALEIYHQKKSVKC